MSLLLLLLLLLIVPGCRHYRFGNNQNRPLPRAALDKRVRLRRAWLNGGAVTKVERQRPPEHCLGKVFLVQ